MQHCVTFMKNTTRWSLALVLVGFSPLLITTGSLASADDPAPCVAPVSGTPGVHVPTGADAGTYTYHCDGAYAGLYYNGYYTYNPSTGARTATYDLDYKYSCSAQKWTMVEYDYSPGQKTFVKSRVGTDAAPDLPTNCPVPTPPAATNTGSPSSSVSSTGDGSQNGVNNSGTINTDNSNANNLGMSNTVGSDATSGDAFVLDNTYGGDATSGDASSLAYIINMLQSTSNVLGDGTATFTANINGDVTGDFIFDPSAVITDTGNGSQNGVNNDLQINTNNSNTTNAQIDNNIDVSATSGDASVNGNTHAGNATSGNATAIVNLMNFINSTVAAGQSFVGTININGNLNGDILLPQNFIDQLIAASGAGSTNNLNSSVTNNSSTTNSTTSDITNNLASAAVTGDATDSGNTNGGNAMSGNAKTNVTLLNLTGSNVVGKNDLLVFVNVLGTWVGMIVNAPAGSTSAELGGGITSTGANSTNGINGSLTTNGNTTNTNNFGITNNVNVAATSGDANVKDNTNAGNATSGDASTGVNILNMTGSNLSLSNWFGVLFINVLGNWNGSFGVNTAAGNKPSDTAPETDSTTTASTSPATHFANFISHNTGSGSTSGGSSDGAVDAVLGSSTTVAKKVPATHATIVTPTPDNAAHASYTLPLLGFGAAAILLLIGERDRFFKKK